MNIKEMFLDSSRYAASDWTKFISLGILFVLTDFLDRLSLEKSFLDWIWLVFLVWIILFFIQAGYIFRIIEFSVKGHDQLPHFNNLKNLFQHGVKDSVVFTIYLSFPLIFFLIFLIADSSNWTVEVFSNNELLFWVLTAGSLIFFILFQGAILNMAHHEGRFRSAFNFKEIYLRIKRVKIQKFVITCILTGIIIWLLEPFFLEDVAHSIDYPLGAIIDVIIAPYLAILTSRFLGIMDRY
ncbi:DUF4013 domain-containing protein [Methanobacterium alkalithermotolerans]|uniref:DUF4013 domain-containing protein n=1 Tax=Methanobacterium alkalithermotolerans TaxID=2731220 RepID=A0A8T8KCJ4_9EURY|nr:DUF4013 domain-containing protein [Methanobacterium alkalithermotolerans]QUH23071.1 DUF4013 domain-containing protein [Methanobacterium alkalithermotolerans]